MNWIDVVSVGLALLGGAALGIFFFGGLWWTVKQLPTSRNPALLMIASFAVRSLGLLAGLVLISGGEVLLIGAAMAGFILARLILVRRQSQERLDVHHAAKS